MSEIPIPIWLQLFLLIGTISGAITTYIRMVRRVKKSASKIIEFIDDARAFFKHMNEEYSHNGGSSTKDLIQQMVIKLDIVAENQDELLSELKEMRKEIEYEAAN